MDIIERITNATGAEAIEQRETSLYGDHLGFVFTSPQGYRTLRQRLEHADIGDFELQWGGHKTWRLFVAATVPEDAPATAQAAPFSIGERVSVKHDLRYFDLTEGGSSAIALYEAQAGVIVSIPRVDKPVVRFDEGSVAYQWPIPADWLRRIEPGDVLPDDEPMTWDDVSDIDIDTLPLLGVLPGAYGDKPTVWASEHAAVVAERDALLRWAAEARAMLDRMQS